MFMRTTYPIHRYPYIYFPLPHSQCISGMTVVFFVPWLTCPIMKCWLGTSGAISGKHSIDRKQACMICASKITNGSRLWLSHTVLWLVLDMPRRGRDFCPSSTYPLIIENAQLERSPQNSSLSYGAGTEIFMAGYYSWVHDMRHSPMPFWVGFRCAESTWPAPPVGPKTGAHDRR